MRISAVSITNFKRIEDVTITPDADRTIILLGGKNRQGKSSTLDALTAAFGGKKTLPSDPVRHGADEAEIRIELDGGELTINRTIQPDGESVLEVRDRLGAVKSPQAMLDKLIGSRFLDPLQWLQLAAKEQRAQLMRLIPDAARIIELDGKRDRVFSRRTEIGRDLTKAKGELARLPETAVDTPIDVASLSTEMKQHDVLLAERSAAERTREQCERETVVAKGNLEKTLAEKRRIESEIERLKSLAVEIGMKSAEWAEDVKKCAQVEAEATAKIDDLNTRWLDVQPRRAELDAQLGKADEHNRTVYAAEAANKRRTETTEAVAKLAKESEDLTKVLETIDERKASILAAAKLPVEGLGVDDEGITLAGVPFAQASGAERMRVALALAIAGSPGLDDIWVRDAALLDEESVALVAEQAKLAGKTVWLERVGTSDPGVIVISNGRVAS